MYSACNSALYIDIDWFDLTQNMLQLQKNHSENMIDYQATSASATSTFTRPLLSYFL